MTTAIALAADYTSLLQLLESSDELTPEMIADTLECIEGELADKLDAIMVIARNNLGHAKTCDEEIKRLAERKKHFENKDKALRKYILSCLMTANLDKLKTSKNTFSARKGSISVVIDNEKL
ncbi:siphovirus Gp157 family protein, partial [Salmonella enterica subsp. enterica serovar Newport]